MKTNYCSVIVTALAVGTLGLLTTAKAGPLMKFSRFSHFGGNNDELAAGFQKKHGSVLPRRPRQCPPGILTIS